MTFVADRAVEYYGPLDDAVGSKYLAQRCRVHDTPDTPAYCDPEWEPFDVKRHADMTRDPHLNYFVDDLIRCKIPSVEIFAIALRNSLTQAECHQLAERLVS